MTEQQTNQLYDAFDRWWLNEGSEMAPLPGHDHEAHARRIARIAWINGAYVKLHHISPPIKPQFPPPRIIPGDTP